MSRGLGPVQRRTIEVLAETQNKGLPIEKLKARIGGDRSNARRVVRSLMKRKLAEEYGMVEDGPAGARTYVRLTFIGLLLTFPYPLPRSWPLPPGDPYVPYTSAEALELKRSTGSC